MEQPWYRYANVRATMCIPSKMAAGDYAQKEVDITEELGCDTLMFFVENEGLAIYPSGVALKDPLVGDRDLLAEVVESANERGIRVVACWYGAHCNTHLNDARPEWRVCTADGPSPTMCYNSPFREWLLGQIREVVEGYDVVGVYVDGMMSPLGTCYCDCCREKYMRDHGSEAPQDIWNADWRDFGYNTVAETARDIRQTIDEASAEVVFALDCHGAIIGSRESGEAIHLTAPYVDVYVLECYWNICKEPPWYVGMESRLVRSETGKHVWVPKWVARHPDQDYSLIPSTAAKIWFMEAVSSGAGVAAVDQGAFWFDRTCFPALQDSSRYLAELRPYLLKSTPVKYAALLHSMETKAVRIHKTPRDERQHFEGFYLACQEAHVPFDVVTEKELLDGSVSEYPVLVLPNVEYMSDKVIDAVNSYVDNGGGVVMTHLTGTNNERQDQRSEPALAELAGVRHTGQVLLNGREEGSPSTNYYEAIAEHEITAGMRRNTYSYSGHLAVVEVDEETHVLVRTRGFADTPGREEASHFRWFPGDLAHPLITVKQHPGSGGRVVYISGELDAAFWIFGWPEAGSILGRSIVHAANTALPFSTDCPQPVLITQLVAEDERSVTILLVNYATNHLYSIGFPGGGVANTQDQSRAHEARYSITHKNIRLNVPGVFARVEAITGQALEWSLSDSNATIMIPRLDEYEAVILAR